MLVLRMALLSDVTHGPHSRRRKGLAVLTMAQGFGPGSRRPSTWAVGRHRGGCLQRRQQPLDQARVEEGRTAHRVALRVKDAEPHPVALLVEQPELRPVPDSVVVY